MATIDGLDTLKISADKKKYIVDVLNPVLEEMVTECIKNMPEDPATFMIKFLEKRHGKAAVEDPRTSRQDAPSKADVESSEEDSDEDDEPPEGWMKSDGAQAKARQSVSAEAYGAWNVKREFVAPVIAKSEEQKARIRRVLQNSFLFSTLEGKDFDIVIGAMKEVPLDVGERCIDQGDDGDCLFVIEQGKLNCIIKAADGAERVVKTVVENDVVGELALLYNCPRAASVESTEPCTLWQLDRDTFNHIVKDAAQKKRERYDAFLSKVPLLKSMDAYERSQLADALKSDTYSAGTSIVREGEAGDVFYIIEEGGAVATKSGAEVMSYSVGDYFGELALIKNQPRAATVTAKGEVKALRIDAKSFKRLFNIQDLIAQSDKYT